MSGGKGGNPPIASRFQPGRSGNPGGRPKNRMTIEALRNLIDRFMYMTPAQLQAKIKDPSTPMVEIWIASTVAQGAKGGDVNRMAMLLERRLGKVKDEIELSAKPYVIERRDGSQLELGAGKQEQIDAGDMSDDYEQTADQGEGE